MDFLGLRNRYLEKDLEDAILRELENFLLEFDQSGIYVAEYLTGLPSRQLLEKKLHEAVALPKTRLENRLGLTAIKVK